MRPRALALVAASLLALLPPVAAVAPEAASADVTLSGPPRVVVEGEQSVYLTLTLSLQGVSCVEPGEATVHLMVAMAEGFDAELEESEASFVLPRGDWTTRAYRAEQPVNLTVRGSADAGTVRVSAWLGGEDVSGCFALMGVSGDKSTHEIEIASEARTAPQPPIPRDAPAPPAEPPRTAAAPASSQPQESVDSGSSTRPIALRPGPLPGPVILLLAVAAGGLFAVVMQRRARPA